MSDAANILVVEDEEALRVGTCDVLAFNGYQPTPVETGEDGLKEALTGRFDLVLLDVMLPEMNGFEVCRQLREAIPAQPVLMLTAKGSEEDILTGFRSGADDYLTKPFSIAELLVRMEALLRRSGRLPEQREQAFSLGAWSIEPATGQATRDGHAIELTEKEVDLARAFVRDAGRLISRRRLLQDVWGWGKVEDVQTRTVDVHVAKLRKKLGKDGALIETLRGEGYRYNGVGSTT
ncbi:MAG: response regulator transcription factor [Acidobacteriota bacterium]